MRKVVSPWNQHLFVSIGCGRKFSVRDFHVDAYFTWCHLDYQIVGSPNNPPQLWFQSITLKSRPQAVRFEFPRFWFDFDSILIWGWVYDNTERSCHRNNNIGFKRNAIYCNDCITSPTRSQSQPVQSPRSSSTIHLSSFLTAHLSDFSSRFLWRSFP